MCRSGRKPYFAGQYHRRGRQLGRVLATQYEEVVVDRLFAGNVQLIKTLQPLLVSSFFLLGGTYHLGPAHALGARDAGHYYTYGEAIAVVCQTVISCY